MTVDNVHFWIDFLVIGRLMMFLARKSPYFVTVKWDFLKKLFACDLCLGVWAYSLLAIAFRVSIPMSIGYVPFLSEFITGCIAAFFMYIFMAGINTLFREIHITME